MLRIIYSDLNAQASLEPAQFKNNLDEASQRLLLVFSTLKKTRWRRYDFGCYLKPLLFEPCDNYTASRIKHEIEDAVLDPNNGLLDIKISQLEVIPDIVNQQFWVSFKFTVPNLESEESSSKLEFNLKRQ